MLKLYASPGACSQATHIALEEAGAEYQAIRVNFAANQQRSPEYLALNPKGRVPALVTPQGTLTETPALLLYVAQTHPAAKLAPTEPFALARLQSFNAFLCATVHVAHAHRPRASRWADDPGAQKAMQAKVPQNMREAFALIERDYLNGGPWVMGADHTVADPYLFTLAGWLASDGVEIAEFPTVAAHRARMAERPAVRKVLAAFA